MKYLVIDTETGGIDSNTTLLTAYFGAANAELHVEDELDLKLKPDGPYSIDPAALEVNHIDLVKHDKEAELKSTAGKKLYDFIAKHSDNGASKLIPVGHGIYFDLGKVWENLLNRATFEKFVSYRRIDTGVVAQFQKLQGLVPAEVSGSLESLGNYYGCNLAPGYLHTAKYDARLTLAVLAQQLRHGR